MASPKLPAHIRQLVDKNNFVIAIKTLAQEQNISLEQAKALIDEYEASKTANTQVSPSTVSPIKSQQGFNHLTPDIDTHLKQENITLPLVPYWVKRVMVVLIVVGLLGWLIWRVFG